jgi:lysophospholipase L1-like esterase
MYNTGSYPALVEDEGGIEIEGELWEVDDACLKMLDAIEGVPTLYERRPVVMQNPALDGVETYVVGFGTNDLGIFPDLEAASHRIIRNLDSMARAIRDREKKVMLFNVPYVNESVFPRAVAEDARRKRGYHNNRLRDFCQTEGIPLADICSHLRDEHFGDELHPNDSGAKIIAEEVFSVLGSGEE